MKKASCKAVSPKGKKTANTITPPHIITKSVTIASDDGTNELVISAMSHGAGFWITRNKEATNCIAIYSSDNEMAIGIHKGNGPLVACLCADSNTGEGILQLVTATGECVQLTATQIVNAVRSIDKLMTPTVPKAKAKAKAPKAAKVPTPAAPKVAKPKKAKKKPAADAPESTEGDLG
jgi:hypothetical protein